MLGLGAATRIYVATGATDMRLGFNGLYGLVRNRLACDPLNGQLVQLFQVAHSWHGDKMVAPKLAAFALDAIFFVTFAGRAELRMKAPV
jgi:hypothetical protein